jgi:hypothetical protein
MDLKLGLQGHRDRSKGIGRAIAEALADEAATSRSARDEGEVKAAVAR